jgi:ATP-dependent DNA ligase
VDHRDFDPSLWYYPCSDENVQLGRAGVAQIKFTEWTSDNQLHQPIFLGLRTDKAGP